MQIQNDEIGGRLAGMAHCLEAVGGFTHGIAAAFEHGADQFPAGGFIVRYENFLHVQSLTGE